MIARSVRTILTIMLLTAVGSGLFAQPAFAEHPWSVLPHTDEETGAPGKFKYLPDGTVNAADPYEIEPQGCFLFLYEEYESAGPIVRQGYLQDDAIREKILACALKTGKIHSEFIPFYILHVANLLVFLAGFISIIFIIIGGYQYILGGVTGNTEKGKKTVFYAMIGLVVVILSFFIVQVVQVALTTRLGS